MNMKRLSLVFAVLLLAFTQHVHAQYYSVNYDARTVRGGNGSRVRYGGRG